jgi:hypothetical protein
VRQLIIKEGWDLATSAGWFGWGRLVEVGVLESIDNAYLLIAIQRGWLALLLWLALPVAAAVSASQGLRRTASRSAGQTALLGFCAMLGTMVAMCTVYLGGVYPSIFVVLIALTVNAVLAAGSSVREGRRPALIASARVARSPA